MIQIKPTTPDVVKKEKGIIVEDGRVFNILTE